MPAGCAQARHVREIRRFRNSHEECGGRLDDALVHSSVIRDAARSSAFASTIVALHAIPLASGLIAGEALVAIGIPLLVTIGLMQL